MFNRFHEVRGHLMPLPRRTRAVRVFGLAGRLRHFVAVAMLGLTLCMLSSAEDGGASERKFPDVVEVKVYSKDADTFDFYVTVSSPYDTPGRYADGFRVFGKDGEVYGERRLLHDHADEQPFTRSLQDVLIPTGITTVVVQVRDLKYGYGGKTVEVALPGR